MEREIIIDVLKQFHYYNGIPVFLAEEGKLLYTSLSEHVLKENLADFFRLFRKEKVDVRKFNKIEYFASIPYRHDNITEHVIIGACYTAHPTNIGFKGRLALEHLVKHEHIAEILVNMTTLSESDFLKYVNVISRLLGNVSVDDSNITSGSLLQSELDKQLAEFIFETRENELTPYLPESERKVMDMVKAGKVEEVKKIRTSLTLNSAGLEVKYLFKIVALVTVATRAALESGVDKVEAYGLSDLYLAMLSNAVNDKQVSDIAKNVLPHFAELVRKNQEGEKETGHSYHLKIADKYIRTHLHFPLTLSTVAEYVGISAKYLSRLFVLYKKEKFTRYVNRLRVNEAKELLVNTNRKLVDIAYSLSFVSESYFIKVFEDICGLTPQKYRNKYKTDH